MKQLSIVIAMVVAAGAALSAHVGVSPKESKAGATETYTFTVPSEGGMNTSSLVIDIPEGVTVLSVSAPEGAAHTEKKEAGRIVQVTWTIAIKAGASAQVGFTARNPTQGSELVWKVHQKYSDGMSSDWTGAPGSRSPAPVTKLVPAMGPA